MRLDPGQSAIIILMVALGVQLTRWLPFLLFPEKKELPQVVLYLGKVLPAAMMGLLGVDCPPHGTWPASPPGARAVLASLTVVLLHRWKENVLLSIGGGTALYMLLVQVVFA